MGNLINPEKPLKEIIRENQRMLKKSIRELEREITNLKKQEAKLIIDIKKAAKENQMKSARIMAKDLVRNRNYVAKFIEMKTHLNAFGLKMQTIKSHDAMAQAMKGVTKAMVQMNKKVNLPQFQKIMAEFMRENEKAELMGEIIGDTLDDAMAEEGSAEAEEAIVNQVLDELGIGTSELVPEAPTMKAAAAEPAAAEGNADPAMDELEARLANLRR